MEDDIHLRLVPDQQNQQSDTTVTHEHYDDNQRNMDHQIEPEPAAEEKVIVLSMRNNTLLRYEGAGLLGAIAGTAITAYGVVRPPHNESVAEYVPYSGGGATLGAAVFIAAVAARARHVRTVINSGRDQS